MHPIELFSFADVAAHSGCHQFSDWRIEYATFTGNFFNVIAAMSYMLRFA